MLIELDGLQHFKQINNWKSPEETKIRDIFKNKSANENRVIRICQKIVLDDSEDWINKLTKAINSNKNLIKIESIYNI